MNGTYRLLATVCTYCAVALLLTACARNAPQAETPALQPTAASPAVASPTATVAPASAAAAENTANTAAATPLQETAAAAAATAATASAGPPVGLAGRRATPAATVALLPTVTSKPAPERAAQLLPTPTLTPSLAPAARTVTSINVRSGPGTAYPVVGGLAAGSSAPIVGRNVAGDWWQVDAPGVGGGWLYAPLVETVGNTVTVAVAVNIPALPTPPPPTDSPTPLPAVQVTETPPAAPAGGPDFRVLEKRLWDVYENGGFLVGDSVHCGEKRQLVVNVLDAGGSRINGVAVQAEYGAREVIVTGSQGRGDGVAEFVLGGGQDVKVIRDNDGRAVTSEVATGLSTNPAGIPFEYLIAARYCTDEASCRHFVDAPGCYGHFSWNVTFQRGH